MSKQLSAPADRKGRRQRNFSGILLEVLPVDPWFLRLKKARLRAQLSQRDLATILRISNVAISHWERGVSFPNKKKLDIIETILNEKIFETAPKIYAPGNTPEGIQLLLIYNMLDESKQIALIKFAQRLKN